jgi:TonB family protein
MEKGSRKRRGRAFFFWVFSLLVLGVLFWVFFSTPYVKPWLRTLTRESRRILGWEKDPIPPEEKKIREEVIGKKMEDPSLYHDWRALAPEYPRPRKMEGMPAKERLNTLKETPEFKEMDKELKEYLRKKEDLFQPEVPVPSLKEGEDLVPAKDRGTEKVMERLLSTKEKSPREKALEENVLLGIKGPLASRKIVERPAPPHGKVKTEAEIELTFWVLPNGRVDRVVPSVRGDAELEQIAIQYLKQWRFAPLPKDQPQGEQWGTLPIRFRLQ